MSTSDATRQQEAIVAAALDLLASGGPQALRVRDIAQAAGCTTMAVYSRFGGKDGVIEAIYVDGFRRFADALEEAAGGSNGDAIEDRAVALGMAYREWALANPGAYQVMFTEAIPGCAPGASSIEVAMHSFEVLLRVVADLRAHAVLHHPVPSVEEMAWALWGMAHGLVMLELGDIGPAGDPVPRDRIYRTALHAIVRGFLEGVPA